MPQSLCRTLPPVSVLLLCGLKFGRVELIPCLKSCIIHLLIDDLMGVLRPLSAPLATPLLQQSADVSDLK